jgi:hypothetical protein
MELVAAGLWGIRRFAEKGSLMDVAGSPIAIVGPNEAGKTTFLRTLQRLNDDDPIPPEELTRGGNDPAQVLAVFRLETDDLAAIAHLPLSQIPRKMTVEKYEDGALRVGLDPIPRRDLSLLESTRTAIASFLKSRWANIELDDDVERPEEAGEEWLPPRAALASIAGLLEDDDLLDVSTLHRLDVLTDLLEEAPDLPATGNKVVKSLRDLHDRDSAGDPVATARGILFRRRPTVLWFDESWRQLESQFDAVNGPISPAMRALFDLIEFDLGELRNAISRENEPLITELIDNANDGFDSLFSGRWRQSRLRARVDRNGQIVLVYVHNAWGRLIPIAERSEGLRQFIALQAFVESEAEGKNVILLIDEAENHLHYDAQADLVQMFSEQAVVEKIIYTTHSAACLPTDLGTGIRVIEPCGSEEVDREDWEHSRVRNAFWSTGPGFSPLLMAMGASTFAFSSLRRALIGEGISEVILLPTLFREATGEDHINFQVVPGISNVRIEDVDEFGELNATAARVAYVVDGDKSGLNLKKRLLDAKVPEDRVFVLGGDTEALTIEDLLVKDLYVESLNIELASKGLELTGDDLPDTGRKAAVKKWCRRKKVDTPTEREVAQNLLQLVRERRSNGCDVSLLDPARLDIVKTMHDEIDVLLASSADVR